MRSHKLKMVYYAFTGLNILMLTALLFVAVQASAFIVKLVRQPALKYTEMSAQDCQERFAWSKSVRSTIALGYVFKGPENSADRKLENGTVMRLKTTKRIEFYLDGKEDGINSLLESSQMLIMLYPNIALWFFFFQVQKMLKGILKDQVFFSPAYNRRLTWVIAAMAAGPAIDFAAMQLLKPLYAHILSIAPAHLGIDLGYTLVIYVPVILLLATIAVFMRYGAYLKEQEELTV